MTKNGLAKKKKRKKKGKKKEKRWINLFCTPMDWMRFACFYSLRETVSGGDNLFDCGKNATSIRLLIISISAF